MFFIITPPGFTVGVIFLAGSELIQVVNNLRQKTSWYAISDIMLWAAFLSLQHSSFLSCPVLGDFSCQVACSNHVGIA